MTSKLDRLIDHRDAILLAELGALIHDLGKLSEEFISNKSIDNPLNIVSDEHAQWIFKWYPFMESDPILNRNIKILNKQILLKNIIKKHHSSDGELLGLFKRSADGLDSGIDKGAVVGKINRQPFTKTFISTSFGYEFERIEVEKESLKKYRNEFVKVLEQVLTEINSILSSREKIPVEKWINLRKKVIKKAKECFIHALGETRRSANDVTLWDHSYSTASLYKTALTEIILSDQWKDPSRLKWRLLLIRFNGLDYIFKGVKIGDIEGRRAALVKSLDKTKELLEVIVPIGNEIYRDENGAVYLIPESFDGNVLKEKFKLEDENVEKNLYERILEIFEEETKGELRPKIEVSEEKSRGAQILGFCLEKHKQTYNQPFLDYIKSQWDGKGNKVVCTICGLKPADQKEKICEDCKSIRKKRVEEWKRNRNTTIWIDEICDESGRIGIIVGSFDLRWWLNGMWLNTCFTKTLDCLKEEKSEIFANINSYDDLIRAVEEALTINDPDQPLKSFKKSDGSNILVKELLKSLGGDSYINQSANDYFEAFVLNREKDVIHAYNLDPTNLSNREKAQLLTLALMRKNPSFARIRRIWETCAKFWKDVENEILSSLDERTRYKIILDESSKGILKDLISFKTIKKDLAYEMRCKGFRVPIIIVNNEIIIVEALEVLKIKDEFEKAVKEGFEIWEPSEYGYHAEKVYPRTRDEPNSIGKALEKDSNYKPYIPILTDVPEVFVCLVPLKDSWEILKKIKTSYEVRFSKVQNRLPIKLGLIAFKRKFPLYIALDCVKRFSNESIEEYAWIVEESDRLLSEKNYEKYLGKLGNYAQRVRIRSLQSYRHATIFMSYSLGDPDLEDKFYPYFIIEDQCTTLLYKDFSNKTLKKANIYFGLKHVKDLRKDDKIIFIPSIFDFEFLDSNVRRFDIGKKRKHWLFTGSKNEPKPYLLWDMENFERLRELINKLNLTTTQMMNLYGMLISKLEEWNLENINTLKKDEAFEKFVENTIKSTPLRLKVVDEETAKGKINKKDYKFLKESILNGMFFDFIDLWHTILKFKFEEGGEQNA
jgi:CRISPR-associated Csx11 family protein